MTTKVPLPPSLLYPVEVIELLAPLGSSVKKHQPLIKFKYWNRVPDGVASEEDGEEPPLVRKEFYGTFECPFDGKLITCDLQKGDRVNDSLTTVLEIAEGCDHSVQYGGLCALCGRSLDEKDYMGYSDTDRAPIAMSHDSQGLTVSLKEAERIETRSTERLLADRRLILVVDLDQTVIHASVNPDIGRWISEENSPNHDVVRDVRSFSLKERNGPGDREQTCWYYVKLRPGLAEFLEAMSEKYEMHIYTMATKSYALEIAKIIDPTGKFFSDRILSRDASGNLLHKDLKRLFPVTTRMVTIIDDRGDVWNWSPNLIRVVQYQFWSGTGDINSQFLPRRVGLLTPDHGDQSKDGENDNDKELTNIGKALSALHTEFYKKYDPMTSAIPDVGRILPALKSEVFDNCVILFSGHFPLGTNLENADIVQWVRSFGAIVLADFLPSVTHVIAKTAGTMKARQAAGRGKLVVSIDWVYACLEHWKHVPEDPYIIDVPDPITADEDDEAVVADDVDDAMDKNIAEGFMRSLSRGEMDWGDMDEELKELLSSDESDEHQSDDDTTTKEKTVEEQTVEEETVKEETVKEDESTPETTHSNGDINSESKGARPDGKLPEEPTKDASDSHDTTENDGHVRATGELKRKREEVESDDEEELFKDLGSDWD